MGRRQSPERAIGRGEVAESQIEAPIFMLLMIVAAAGLAGVHLYYQNTSLTIAAAVSLLAFGATVFRVEYGLYLLLIAMLLSPEIEYGEVGRDAGRELNLRYDDVLIVVIFLGVLVKHTFEGRPLAWRGSPINSGIVAYYGVCLLSTLLALRISVLAWDRDLAFFVLVKMLEFYFIFFMVGMAVTSMGEVRRQLGVFLAVSAVVSAYGIASIGTQPRVSAPFEAGGTEPNTLGGYLMIVMIVALSLGLLAATRGRRIVLLTIAGLAAMPFLMTLSRASYGALLVTVLAWGLVTRRFWIPGMVAVAVLAAPLMMPSQVVTRVQSTFEPSGVPIEVPFVGEVTIDKSAYERVYVWQKVQNNLGVWPVFGGGIAWGSILDSQFARVLIETGVAGFAAFVFLLWRILLAARQTYFWSRDPVGKALAVAMFSLTLGLIVHSFGTISFLIVRIMEPYWFLLALMTVSRQIAILDHQQRRAAATRAAATPAVRPAAA
jgi:O-antigen ligase